jgi:hypothetical protein
VKIKPENDETLPMFYYRLIEIKPEKFYIELWHTDLKLLGNEMWYIQDTAILNV